ncbi:MAG TPA: hypothetical protein VK986_13225, partial [Tepidisphaeraceae bacterium]|nr:hypothetical protein [Tepidisphaeraceae bacterium]
MAPPSRRRRIRQWARRGGRWALSAATVASAVLCLAVGVVWVGSYWRKGMVERYSVDRAAGAVSHDVADAARGYLWVSRSRTRGLDAEQLDSNVKADEEGWRCGSWPVVLRDPADRF